LGFFTFYVRQKTHAGLIKRRQRNYFFFFPAIP
jgi:hypothetical protein